ncbi:MAG: helix-turn-helix transcriptional regulator, partial [Comamonas sp.]
EFKLKQGFRELFGTSPHRMLTDIRMKKAWELLECGLRVSTVADRVGYRHLSSFSAAFERHYGRTPKSVARAGAG